MKKLLLLTLLLFTLNSFAQQIKGELIVNNKQQYQKSIIKVSAYPNPFISKTNINFITTKPQKITFVVKNLLSKTVYSEIISAKKGQNTFLFNRSNLTKGMYLYSIIAENETISKRMIIK
ncbi:T9SS type A sorting domain-containing protein [Lutibacter sp. TH_r2]|uniref:T9SS type A sorting domain-containing protein n=1 Tax=Lutibacter sp. TH_r2 TaxID=3082083 RepID=UPI002954ACB0|nr:T9SS type A sorting domain-containing protein [Lutibacter sp. TH_r2]MDV7187169.1 T9SS type A sorting domain-containing protein [Lutibacter sp. TH_r2]